MSRTCFIAFLFWLSALSAVSQHQHARGSDSDIRYKPEVLLADLHILETALKEAHPGLYTYHSQDEINHLFDSINKSITTDLTEQQFFSTVTFLTSKIGCGHTPSFLSKNSMKELTEKSGKYFPFRVKIVNRKIYLLSNMSTDSSIVPGSELKEINGVTAVSLLDRLLPHLASDGYNLTLKYHIAEEEFMFYYAELIGQPIWFRLKLKAPGDELVSEHMLPSLHLSEIRHIEEQRNKKVSPEPLREKPLQFALTEDNTGILKIRSFDGNDISSEHQHFKPFIRHVFDTLKYKGVNDLIIDLRNNGGGDDDYGWYLYSFLTDSAFHYYDRVELASSSRYSILKYTNQPRILNLLHLFVKKDEAGKYVWKHGRYTRLHEPQSTCYRGGVFILINGESFSTTAEFSAIVHSHNRAVFIGEETGGAIQGNNSGMVMMLTLPNTHLRIKIPMMRYVCSVPPTTPVGRGIMPDYPILPSMEDILTNTDTELNFGIELIRRKNCKGCGR